MVKGPWIEPEELKRLKMPVLVIAGTKDMIRNGHTRRIYYGIPDSRLRLIAEITLLHPKKFRIQPLPGRGSFPARNGGQQGKDDKASGPIAIRDVWIRDGL